MLQLAQILKRLANQLQLAIVVVNQVGLDGDNTNNNTNTMNGTTDLVAVEAALAAGKQQLGVTACRLDSCNSNEDWNE